MTIAAGARVRTEGLSLKNYAWPVSGLWMAAQRVDLCSVLAQVRLPTLVIHGSADDQCPLSHGEALASGIPRAGLVVWPTGRHNLMAEAPAGMATALAGFAGRMSGTPGWTQSRRASSQDPLDGSSAF